jgi:hypothetical protein
MGGTGEKMTDYNVDQANYRGPGMYRHYKGGTYFVYGLALQENTVTKRDKNGEIEQVGEGHDEVTFVVYKPMTTGSLLEGRPEDFWARELGDFNAQVPDVAWSGDATVPRFEWVSPV